MSRTLRNLGWAGFILTLGGLAVDATVRAMSRQPAGFSKENTTGVEISLGGLGPAEASFVGPLEFVVEDLVAQPDGSIRRVSSAIVRGHDPVRVDDTWVRMTDVVLTRFEPDGRTELFRVESPTGRFKLKEDVSGPEGMDRTTRPALDTSVPLLATAPILHSRALLPGKKVELHAESASVDPLTGAIDSQGQFRLLSSGLLLEGSNLRTGPEEGTLLFGGPGEAAAVLWEVLSPDGILYKGASDNGGTLGPGPGEITLLTLPGTETSRMEFPPDSPLPGVLHSKGLQLEFTPAGGGWAARRATGLAFTRWNGPMGWIRGGPWTAFWNASGELTGFLVEGDLNGYLEDEEFGWFDAVGGAYFTPNPEQERGSQAGRKQELSSEGLPLPPGTVYLFGGSGLYNLEARMNAAWILWDPHQKPRARRSGASTGSAYRMAGSSAAGGGVSFHSASGSSLCDRVEATREGAWRLIGNAVVFPAEGQGKAVAAPEIVIDPQGWARTQGRFQMSGVHDQGPWLLSGNALQSVRRNSGGRAQADGNVVWTSGQTEFRGETLLATQGEKTRVELTGRPAVGTLQDERGQFKLSGNRIEMQEQALFLSGSPFIEVPAEALGLEGAPVKVTAPYIRRNSDETWELSGGVRFEGGLQGFARRMSWSEAEGMSLLGLDEPVQISGRRDGTDFRFKAFEIDLDAIGEIDLRRKAEAEFRGAAWSLGELAGTAESILLTGEDGFFGQADGWFEGAAVIEAGEMTGQAARIEWDADKGQPTELRLMGRASLKSPRALGTGALITFELARSVLRLDGTRFKDARLETAEGRAIVSGWIELDLEEWLISSGQGHWEDQKP